jgi:hypothetical protein
MGSRSGYASEMAQDALDGSLHGAISAFSKSHHSTINQGLQMEILAMESEDQTARSKLAHFKNPSEKDQQAVSEIDQKHRQKLKEIISIFGWPGIRLVGLKGSSAMWLLVQHQDQDLEFQKQCLQLLKEAVNKQDAQYRDYAYLLDRVHMNENSLQVYGTQWVQRNGKWSLYPVENPEYLNQRRLEAGLCSIEEYKKGFKEAYHLDDTDFD